MSIIKLIFLEIEVISRRIYQTLLSLQEQTSERNLSNICHADCNYNKSATLSATIGRLEQANCSESDIFCFQSSEAFEQTYTKL